MQHGQLFDREAEVHQSEHLRPHWMQDGTITFITMRLADSIPKETVQLWDREKRHFLVAHGIDVDDWRIGRQQLPTADRKDFDQTFHRKRERSLDECLGRCVLRDPDVAKIVADSMLHFDEDRYRMGDFVIMPNHVHMLVVFPTADLLKKQCYSWTHYTATMINRWLGSSGTLWQDEPFDHLVRSEKQLVYLRRYIAENPSKAGLRDGEFIYRRSSRRY